MQIQYSSCQKPVTGIFLNQQVGVNTAIYANHQMYFVIISKRLKIALPYLSLQEGCCQTGGVASPLC